MPSFLVEGRMIKDRQLPLWPSVTVKFTLESYLPILAYEKSNASKGYDKVCNDVYDKCTCLRRASQGGMLSRWLIDRLKIAYYVPFSSTSTSEEFLGHNTDSTSKTKCPKVPSAQVMVGCTCWAEAARDNFLCPAKDFLASRFEDWQLVSFQAQCDLPLSESCLIISLCIFQLESVSLC